jgi:hypothetical protein
MLAHALLLGLACATSTLPPVDADGDGAFLPMDCDDADAAVSPDATEACGNGVDDDCDGVAVGCGPAGWTELTDADARVFGVVDEANHARLERAATVGDADGDGVADLLVRVDQGYPEDLTRVWLLPGTLTGDVALDDRAPIFTGVAHGTPLVGGDLDGDGLPDLALTGWDAVAETGVLQVLPGPLYEGGGPDDARAVVTLGQDYWQGPLVRADDTDGDGLPELLVGEGSMSLGGERAGAVWIVPGTVSGAVEVDAVATRIDGTEAEARAGYLLAAGDLDGDGLSDAVIGALGYAWILPGPLVDGTLADATAKVGGLNLWEVAVGDTNGDGALDLVLGGESGTSDFTVSREWPGGAYVLAGPFAGERTIATADATIYGAPDTWYAGELAAAPGDLDGDGRGEVALVGDTGFSSGAIFVFRGGVSGTHTVLDADAVLYDPDGYGVTSLLGPGDLDADGFADLVGVGSLSRSDTEQRGIAWLVRGGAGF